MRELRSLLQASECVPVPEIQAGRHIILFYPPNTPFELQEISEDRRGANHKGHVRIQV